MAYAPFKRDNTKWKSRGRNQNYKKPKTPRITNALAQVWGLPEDKQLASAVAVRSSFNAKTSSTYLQDVSDYSDANLNDRKKVLTLSRNLRNKEGICSTVADLWIDFGVTRGRFECDNEELKKLLNDWAMFVNAPDHLLTKGVVNPTPGIRLVSRKIFDDYLTDGDSVFILYWKSGVKMGLSENEKPLFLPVSIRTLDTNTLSMDENLAAFGIEVITLKIDDKLKKKLLEPKNPGEKFLQKQLPPEWLKLLRANQPIILDPNVTFHVKRNPKDYKPWGEPIFVKAFTAIANKRRLQAVDASTIDGLINRFTIFKIGLADSERNKAYHIPKPARIAELQGLLSQSTRMNTIIWPGPDLDYIDIGPDSKTLEFIDKYKQVDLDILRALHTSPLLIDGGSSGQSIRDWAAFVSTEVGLDAFRDELEKIFTQIGRDIAIANKLKYERLAYRFDSQLLKDEKYFKNFALKVFEMGGTSYETFLERVGEDFITEKARKENEFAAGIPELFVNRAPYAANSDQSVNPDGRDPGTTNTDKGEPVQPKTETKNDRASASFDLSTLYLGIYVDVFEKMRDEVKHKKSLSTSDFFAIELSLISGFLMFKTLTEYQIQDVVKRSGGISASLKEKLVKWNSEYIDKFYNQMIGELRSAYSDIGLFDSILNSQGYRLVLYSNEITKKVVFASKWEKAVQKGFTRAKWIAIMDNTTCEECESKHEQIFDINEIFDLYPAHPHCRCDFKYLR